MATKRTALDGRPNARDTVADPIDERPTLEVPAPRREVRRWITTRGAVEATRDAATFARVTLADGLESTTRRDPIRGAERLESAAARLLCTAAWLRRLEATRTA